MKIYFKCMQNGKETYYTEDKQTVYERFASCMIARYINKSPWVKRVKSESKYDGTYIYKFYGEDKMIYEFRIER